MYDDSRFREALGDLQEGLNEAAEDVHELIIRGASSEAAFLQYAGDIVRTLKQVTNDLPVKWRM